MNLLIITAAFIAFDIATGFLKAIKNKCLNSSVLRNGLFHKLAEIFAVCGSWGLVYASKILNFGIDIPLVGAVTLYICIMEMVSIIENLCELNPNLYKLFKPYLEKLKSGEDDNV